MSDIADIRERIDQEIAAMAQVKNGYAVVARHDIITHHFDALATHLGYLKSMVGEETAIQMLADQLEQGV